MSRISDTDSTTVTDRQATGQQPDFSTPTGGTVPSGGGGITGPVTGTANQIIVVNGAINPVISLASPVTFPTYFTTPATGNFFQSLGANIDRMSDRVFVGAAVVNDGNYPNITADWLATFQAGLGFAPSTVFSQFNCLVTAANASNNAGVFGTQSFYAQAIGAFTGLTSIALNNSASYACAAVGLYVEAHNLNATVAGANAAELSVVQRGGSAVAFTPYVQGAGGTVDLQLSAGVGSSATGQQDNSVAINIIGNPMKFVTGINFFANAITGTDGTTGTGTAIALAKGHTLTWYESGGHQTSAISGGVATYTLATRISFSDSGFAVTDALANNIVLVPGSATAIADYFTFTGGISASNLVSVGVAGTDTDISLGLSTKGAGVISTSNPIVSTDNTSYRTWQGSSAVSARGTFVQRASSIAGEYLLGVGFNTQVIGSRCGGTFAAQTATPSASQFSLLFGSFGGMTWTFPCNIVLSASELHSETARGMEIQLTTTANTTLTTTTHRFSNQGNLLLNISNDTGLTGAGGIRAAGTTDATTGGAGTIITAGGIYAAKSIIAGTALTCAGVATFGTAGTAITNIRHGITVALVLGTKVISDTGATANTRYFFTVHSLGTVAVPSSYYASARSPGVSFTVTSAAATDTSTLDWLAIEP